MKQKSLELNVPFFQVENICTFNNSSCYQPLFEDNFGCKMSCHGFYAEIQYSPEDSQDIGIDDKVFSDLAKEYTAYKNRMMKNLVFDPTEPTLGLAFIINHLNFIIN